MRRSTARHALLATALVVGSVHVVGSIHTGDLPGNGDSWALGLAAVGHAALGWFVIGRRPQLRIGWLMLCGGVLGTTTFLAAWWAQDTLLESTLRVNHAATHPTDLDPARWAQITPSRATANPSRKHRFSREYGSQA